MLYPTIEIYRWFNSIFIISQGKLDISQRHISSLEEGDLYNPLGITECISAAKVLLEAFHTPFKPGRTFKKKSISTK